ncbi:rhodanese-like domain-containing protein [Massilia sp. PAMC28688]|uniref:rhodanese-like domain-containing protein n=1 Tax=Massilia sp. PAMC28688 TaxID=2861283 RepID=UPI001C625DB6|nr:rhodanese-like domain-containing protein [Massilia sp. PAMC28688]QYF92099.1 rhodanese-like domain-containing protein [Massilia sp. PAMC28688]
MFAMLMGLKTIAPRELHARMREASPTIIDLNAPAAWRKAHVPGALNLAPDHAASALPADLDTSLVFYCSNPLCTKAPRAARRARQLGYTDVRVMSAGITGWVDARLPVASAS